MPYYIGDRQLELLDEAKKYESGLNNPGSAEYFLISGILTLLGNTYANTPEIRDYAAELFARGYPDAYSFEAGLRGQLYTPEQRETYVEYIKSFTTADGDESDGWHAAHFAALGMLEIRAGNSPEGYPIELARYIYETTRCASCRRKAAYLMVKFGLATPEDYAEFAHDSESVIRELAEKPQPRK